mmetsp:Transcript_20511/g.33679  ORF Transcript_20511/g.33679 Transcript_20511/m.33679 type:complete len:337 (-) Transcript_20511:154-1164(-)
MMVWRLVRTASQRYFGRRQTSLFSSFSPPASSARIVSHHHHQGRKNFAGMIFGGARLKFSTTPDLSTGSLDVDKCQGIRGIKDLLVKRRVIFIRKALEEYNENVSPRISFQDFLDICREYGLDESEGHRVAAMLESSLILIRSSTMNGGEDKMLYLRPMNLIDELLREVDPDLKLLENERKVLHQREGEYAEMEREYSSIARRAKRYAQMHVMGIISVLSAKYSFFAYLVYSDGDFALGWDIMEPVTYLYGIFFGNLAIVYIAFFGIQFEVPGYISRVTERRIKHICEKEGFDLEHFSKLKNDISELTLQVRPPESLVLRPPIDLSGISDDIRKQS